MLSLVDLTAEEIENIIRRVSGGARNVQDIYPLAPLQEGILFHHLYAGEGDPYLSAGMASFDNRARLEGYLESLQQVINRHDILRTAIVWHGLREPVQVVWRNAPLTMEEVQLDASMGDAEQQLFERFNPRQYRMDVCQAPLLRACVAYDQQQHQPALLLLVKIGRAHV